MAQIAHRDIGDVWVPESTFTVGGTPTDPTTITVKIMEPDGTVTTHGPSSGAAPTAPVIRTGAGTFNILIPLDASGYWHVEFIGTGTAAATEWHTVIADPSPFADNFGLTDRALVGMFEARDWLNAQQQELPEGLELARVISDVSETFHQEAGREFKPQGANPQVRLFPIDTLGTPRPWYIDGDWQGNLDGWSRSVAVGDLAAFTSVRILANDWAAVVEDVTPLTKITAHPMEPTPRFNPIRRLEFANSVAALPMGGRVEVTGTWGFPQVPGDVRQAVLDAVVAAFDRDVEHYSEGLGTVTQQGGGTNVIFAGSSPRLLSLPPSTLAVAWRYRDTFV